MLIVELPVNEKLLRVESALNRAGSGNIVELCRQYLLLLDAYHDELSKNRGVPEILFHQSRLARELGRQSERVYRSTIENTLRKRDSTASLLDSFISISGGGAVETFNRLTHEGFDDWELLTGGIRSKRKTADNLMTFRDAVYTAGFLRREAYVTKKITFLKAL